MAIRNAIAVIRPKAWLNKLLDTLKTVPGAALMATAKLRFLKNRTVSLNQNTTRAQLAAQEADFTDYPAGGVAVAAPSPVNYNGTSQGWIASKSLVMTTDPTVTGNDIAGYWVDDGTDPIVMEYFPDGQDVSMQTPGDWIELNFGDSLYFLQGM